MYICNFWLVHSDPLNTFCEVSILVCYIHDETQNKNVIMEDEVAYLPWYN